MTGCNQFADPFPLCCTPCAPHQHKPRFVRNRPGGPYSQGSPGMVKAGDINADGYPELIVPGDGKGTLYYYESEGVTGGTLRFKRASLYADPACMPGEARFEDIDTDGYMDIVSVIYDTSVAKDSTSGSIFIFKQDPGADDN